MTYGLRDATVVLGATVALDEVTLLAGPGDIVAVVGGDGAGKSTALRALVGELRLRSGTLSAPSQQQVGYLPASAGSWGALTVRQNMDFAAGMYGLRGADLVHRRDAILERAGLTAAMDRPASQLSGGMRRKLGFCMAFVHHPPLLVLDEPSTGVDPVSRVDLWRLVSQAGANGAAVVLSTTYLDEAERAGRLLALDGGRTLVQGAPDEVRESLPGTVTGAPTPVRREWAWRRGREFHEYWPDGNAPEGAEVVTPDLEDVVSSLALTRRLQAVVG